jgi:hypothetical protein
VRSCEYTRERSSERSANAASPAGVIRPCARNLATLSMFTALQIEPAFLGVKRIV